MAFEKEIKEYEELRQKYQTSIINKMDREEYIKYNEVLFSPDFVIAYPKNLHQRV